MDSFRVKLNSPNNVFFAGQEVSGQIHISLSEPKKLSAVRLELWGEGKVHWREVKNVQRRGSDGNMRSERETFHRRNNESYVNQEAVLFRGEILGVGDHLFPFSLFLPPNLPSSFEGEHGSVRYYVQAVIVRSWLWNHRTRQIFTVNSILDLNHYSGSTVGGETRNSKNFCCFCCKSGPLSVVLLTERSGYVPGEYIVFSAEVDNQSDKEMTNTTVQLLETVIFKAIGGHTKTHTKVITEQNRGRIGPGDSDIWNKATIGVPALPPTNLGGSCGIIQVQYTLEMNVHPSGSGFSLSTKLPITVGTIPLREFIQYIQPSPSTQGYPGGKAGYPAQGLPGQDQGYLPPHQPGYPPQDQGYPPQPAGYPPPGQSGYPPQAGYNPPGGAGYPADPPPAYAGEGGFQQPGVATAPPLPDTFSNYADLPPPSYAESVWGQITVNHDDEENSQESVQGDRTFAPSYPTYNLPKPGNHR